MDYSLKKLADFSSSHSDLIKFLAQNLPWVDLSVILDLLLVFEEVFYPQLNTIGNCTVKFGRENSKSTVT